MIENLDNYKAKTEEATVDDKPIIDEVSEEEVVEEPKPKKKADKKSQNGSKRRKVKAQSIHVVLHSDTSVYSGKLSRFSAGQQMFVEEDLGKWLKVSAKFSGEMLVGYVLSKKVKAI